MKNDAQRTGKSIILIYYQPINLTLDLIEQNVTQFRHLDKHSESAVARVLATGWLVKAGPRAAPCFTLVFLLFIDCSVSFHCDNSFPGYSNLKLLPVIFVSG